MAGNWQDSSRKAEIYLKNGHTYLCAECRNEKGQYVESRLDLDDHIGDENGRFSWWKSGFTHDAYPDSIRFNFKEGGAMQPILRAKFPGNDAEADINTAEHIRNIDGHLKFDFA